MKYLQFFNLLDYEGRISITNVAVMVVLLRLCFASNSGLAETGALFIAVANYSLKRHAINSSTESESDVATQIASATTELDKRVDEINNQLTTLAVKVGLK